MRKIPSNIETDCPELNQAWAMYVGRIVNDVGIFIDDTEEDLNYHAFLGHSIDMQGFRAGEFAGVEEPKNQYEFRSLKERGLGVRELAGLWEIPRIRNHLLTVQRGTGMEPTYDALVEYGGDDGASLADAFRSFPRRKGHWCVRAYLQNSFRLKDFGCSFRSWLKHHCRELGATSFPPSEFRQPVRCGKNHLALEDAIGFLLQRDFHRVGPQMAPYMICDWQLSLWRQGRCSVFNTYKADQFHDDFVRLVNMDNRRIVIPKTEEGFLAWWHRFHPDLPPRLANEVIWFAVEHKLVDKSRLRKCAP